MLKFCCSFVVALLSLASLGSAQDLATREQAFYPLTRFTLPEGASLEVGAIELLEDGRLAIATRRGEIWLISQPFGPAAEMKWTRWAHGLHEVLGLAQRDGWLYVTQRSDVSRLKDSNGDDIADVFEVVNDEWHINGDYHEYAFGSKFDREGNLWVTLCLTGSFGSESKFRGWCLRVTPDGRSIPTTSGIRSPGGMGFDARGEVYYTDNQGPWNGTCALKHLVPGKFVGHPGGFKWYDLPGVVDVMGPKPKEPNSGSRFMTEAALIPEYVPPVILFPYKKMGQSASGVACDTSEGKFGPFAGQLFVGDQTNSTVMRCVIEEVDGYKQGVCFPFREGFGSGTLSLLMSPQGHLFVGGTNRGWGSRGNLPFSLERLDWNGQTPFEIHTIKARPDGFQLTFTEPVDPQTAGNPASYRMESYAYIFQSSYGSPEVDFSTPTVKQAVVSDDKRSVRLVVEGLVAGSIHELHAEGVRSASSQPLLHADAYYTLNRIPRP